MKQNVLRPILLLEIILIISFIVVMPPVSQRNLGYANYLEQKKIVFCDESGYCLEIYEKDIGSSNKWGLTNSALLQRIINMGFTKVDAIKYVYPKIESVIMQLRQDLEVSAEDSVIRVDSGIPVITKEKFGKRIDCKQLCVDLFDQIVAKTERVIIKLNLDIINPLQTKLENQALAQEKSSFKTYITGSRQEGRINNIKTAISKFNGKVLKPNEYLSFNSIIGDTTEENGYQKAKVILNGKYVDDFGGGVCQAATTLYNAALVAGLEIEEANPHSLKVGYVMGSFDAMVSSGISDLIIKNCYDYPIYIYSYATDYECGVKIFGKENEYDIVRRNESLEFDSKELPNVAYKSCGYLDYYKDGELQFSKKIRKDTYILVR